MKTGGMARGRTDQKNAALGVASGWPGRVFLCGLITCAAAMFPSLGWAQSNKAEGPIREAPASSKADKAPPSSSSAPTQARSKPATATKAARKSSATKSRKATPKGRPKAPAKAAAKPAPKAAPKPPPKAAAKAPVRPAPKRAPKAAPKAPAKAAPPAPPPKPSVKQDVDGRAGQEAAIPPIERPQPKEVAKPAAPPLPALSKAQAESRFQQAVELERRGEMVAAVKAFHEAAENGHGPAQKKLGDLYGTGNSAVQRDYETSLRWYQKAREQGIEIPKPFTYPGVRR